MGGVKITALHLSAVTVVTMSAPLQASAAERGSYQAQILEFRTGAQILFQLGGGARVGIEHPQLADTGHAIKAHGLKFALRTIAYQGHDPAVAAREMPCRQYRHGGGAQRRGDREFGQEQRVAGLDVGQHAEGRDREQSCRRILGVSVHVLE